MEFQFTPTHSGLDSKGKGLFGLDGAAYAIPVIGIVCSIALFMAVGGNPESGAGAMAVCLMPTVGSMGFAFYFKHNRPPRFLEDWLDGLAGRGFNITPRRRLKHPYRITESE